MTAESLINYSWRTFFFIARVIIGTWLALIVMVAGHIAWVHSRPATDYINLKRIVVDTSVDPIMVHVDRDVYEDADVIVSAEISSVQDPSFQPCVTGFRSVADVKGSPSVTIPLDNMLANCNLNRVASIGHTFVLKIGYTIELDYGIRKRIIGESEPFTIPYQR